MFSYLIEDQDDTTVVKFTGPINEEAGGPLNNLQNEASSGKMVVFDMEGIEYVNSLGIRTWINFLRTFGEGRSLEMRNCPPDVIVQINMIPKFAGTAKITSFKGFYICPECDHEQTEHFDCSVGTDAILEQNSTIKCQKCGAATEMESDEDIYFEFLNAS